MGKRFKVTCVNLNVDNIEINCSDEIKILGTILVSASKFKISLSKNKISFYVNANKLFSKLGCSNAPVFLSLLNSHCLSALLYNLEVMTLVKSEINSINFALTRTLMKLFNTFSNNNILECMFFSGQLPLDVILFVRKGKFLGKLMKKNNMLTRVLHSSIERDYLSICKAWNNMGGSLPLCKKQAWGIFEKRISTI